MKKLLLLVSATLLATVAFAGGLLTNTNNHIAFARMMARGASTEIDAIYTNPAGLAFFDHDGWAISINNQSAFQTRNVEAAYTLPVIGQTQKRYEGHASAPIIPALFASWKNDKLAVGAFFGLVGGGGKCSFDDGLPMFDAPVIASILQTSLTSGSELNTAFGGTPVTPEMYDLNTALIGKQYIFGGQLGVSYRFNEHISANIGGRLNYFMGSYKGFLDATLKATGTPLVNLAIDCDQTGWGFTPIIGFNYRVAGLTLAAKYEFRTKLNIENDTKELSAKVGGKDNELFGAKLADYKHGVNTPSDIPALLTLAAGYEFTPNLRATVEYHFFDDKNAKMANAPGTDIGKQTLLTRGTHEFLAGVEYDINKMFTVSCGGQRTDYGLSDKYQTDTSFACDSWSFGLGGAVNITEKLRLNVGYFMTIYSDYTVNSENYNGLSIDGVAKVTGTNVYSRTNKVVGVGIDYKF